MARLNQALPQTATTKVPPLRSCGVREPDVVFVSNGEQRRVNLRAPRPVRRDGRWLVPLIDLWVASLLEGDFLDLRFEVVTAGSTGAVRCSTPIDPLVFARGFVDVARRELWWSDPADSPLHGLRLVSVVVLAGEDAPASTRRPVPPEAVVQKTGPGEATRSVGMTESVAPGRGDLRQLLPLAAGYPAVEWRNAPAPLRPVSSTSPHSTSQLPSRSSRLEQLAECSRASSA